MLRLFFLLLPLVPAVAHAECDEAMPGGKWVALLDEIDGAFTQTDFRRAYALLDYGDEGLLCLPRLVSPDELSRFAHQMSYRATIEQENDEALGWAQIAQIARPGSDFGPYVPKDHYARRLLDDSAPAAMGLRDDIGLDPEGGQWLFLNGRFLAQPEGPFELQNLLQVADRGGTVTEAHWLHGLAIPTHLAGDPGNPMKPPRWYEEPALTSGLEADQTTPLAGPSDARRKRMNLGLILGGAAVGLYGASWGARGLYGGSYSDGTRALTNGTYFASVATGAAGAGIFTWGLATR